MSQPSQAGLSSTSAPPIVTYPTNTVQGMTVQPFQPMPPNQYASSTTSTAHVVGPPTTQMVTPAAQPQHHTVVTTPAIVKTTVVTYGDGTIFNVPSRWVIKQAWGWSDMHIRDEWGNEIFYADAKSYSLTRNLGFTDLRTGIEIARIKEKLKFGMPKYGIWVGPTQIGTVSQKFTFVNPKFVVQGVNGPIIITGDWSAHAFTFQRGNQVIATVSKVGYTATDTYGVLIQPGEDVIFILACCIIIDKCITMT